MPSNDNEQMAGIAIDEDGNVAVFYRGAKITIAMTPREMFEFSEAMVRAAFRATMIDEALRVEAAAKAQHDELARVGMAGRA